MWSPGDFLQRQGNQGLRALTVSSLELDEERNTGSSWLDVKPPAKTFWLNCFQQFSLPTGFCHQLDWTFLEEDCIWCQISFQAPLLCCPSQALMPHQNGPDSASVSLGIWGCPGNSSVSGGLGLLPVNSGFLLAADELGAPEKPGPWLIHSTCN